eukprot:4142749-Pyramimonas_sp.AAC.1
MQESARRGPAPGKKSLLVTVEKNNRQRRFKLKTQAEALTCRHATRNTENGNSLCRPAFTWNNTACDYVPLTHICSFRKDSVAPFSDYLFRSTARGKRHNSTPRRETCRITVRITTMRTVVTLPLPSTASRSDLARTERAGRNFRYLHVFWRSLFRVDRLIVVVALAVIRTGRDQFDDVSLAACVCRQ